MNSNSFILFLRNDLGRIVKRFGFMDWLYMGFFVSIWVGLIVMQFAL